MSNLYLFEAGATKTELLFSVEGKKQEISLPGFNPNRENGAFEIAVLEGVHIAPESKVYFYGSGLGNDGNKEIVRRLFAQQKIELLRVYDDILGAARAAFRDNPGIICIMGTGGLAAYYNGKEIVKRRGGYGYLVDDLGGGYELGRRVIAAWLNGDLSSVTTDFLESNLNVSANKLIAEIYQDKDLDLIASVSRIIRELKEDEVLNDLVQNYFSDFFVQNVLPLKEEFSMQRFSVVGSVGTGFYSVIRRLSNANDLQLEQCIESPIQRLFDYHFNQ